MPKTILVIEDEMDCLALMEHILLAAGYAVVKAVNGADGLKAFEEEKPDLVLLDLKLPDMDGLDVCGKIRSGGVRAKTPILFCSVRSGVASVAHALESGADDYVLKPYDADDLVARIEAALKK